MKTMMFTASLVGLVISVAGCDTALEGPYRPYYPESAAGVLWPGPDATPKVESADESTPPARPTTMPAGAEPAGYRPAPVISPSTMPAE